MPWRTQCTPQWHATQSVTASKAIILLQIEKMICFLFAIVSMHFALCLSGISHFSPIFPMQAIIIHLLDAFLLQPCYFVCNRVDGFVWRWCLCVFCILFSVWNSSQSMIASFVGSFVRWMHYSAMAVVVVVVMLLCAFAHTHTSWCRYSVQFRLCVCDAKLLHYYCYCFKNTPFYANKKFAFDIIFVCWFAHANESQGSDS